MHRLALLNLSRSSKEQSSFWEITKICINLSPFMERVKWFNILIVHLRLQGWTGMYTLVVPTLSAKFIKNSNQNLPV